MRKNIIDYIMIKEGKFIGHNLPPRSISSAVREYIEKGYQPFGNPFIDIASGICQAMVKYENVEGE